MKRYFLIYFVAISIPLFLAMSAWQAERYTRLEQETERLENSQEAFIESNKRLIAGITMLSSPERIEYIATNELGFEKIAPESVLQIRISGGN